MYMSDLMSMKLYAVADIHGAQYRMNLVLKNIEAYHPDLVVICGDITQFGPVEMATHMLNQIPVDCFAVRGNCDPLEVNEGIAKSKAINIRLQCVEKNGVQFIGWDPVGTVQIPTMSTESQVFLKKMVHKDAILVSHLPPFGFQDMIFLGKHGGSKEVLAIVDLKKPRLVLCGHIHEDPGVSRQGDSIIVNCSMGKHTEGAIVDIASNIKVTMLE
jgi:Icc-related predicted phosphoesterase